MSTKVDIVEVIPKKGRRRNRIKNKNRPRSKNNTPRNSSNRGFTRNRRRIRNRAMNYNQGGMVDKFPKGNMQGQNFRANKVSNENDMEYIGDVVSTSTGFVVLNSYSVNPGQASVFPWMYKKAILYEKYQFKSLEFIYKPMVSQFASLGTTGKVILSFDYDASDAPPTSKQQMEDTDPSADGMPYEMICLKMRPRDLHKNSDAKYVRPGGLPGGSDIKTYDCGILNIATSGIEANSGTLGELWVKYNCQLTVPVLEPTNSAPINRSTSQLISSAGESLTNGLPHTILFADTSSTYGYANGLGLVNTNGSIVLSPGNYVVTPSLYFQGTGNSTYYELLIEKNGSSISFPLTQGNPSGTYYATMSSTAFISCNGTDVITINVISGFSTGTMTVYGTLVIRSA